MPARMARPSGWSRRWLDDDPMVPIGRGSLWPKDQANPSGQTWEVVQRERQAVLGELLVVPAVELAPCCDGAHLVVELGPADVASAVAEANELHRVGRGCLALEIGW